MKIPLFMTAVLPLLLPVLATAQTTTEFGNINVVQNDAGTSSSSVTLTKGFGSSPGFSIRSGNRGDYDVAFGNANDVSTGVMITSVSQNGRDNSGAGDSFGFFCATSASDHSAGSGVAGTQYWVPIFRAAQGDEVNINVACAWFSYSSWLGGFARNSTGANGGANNVLTASPGINLGTQFVDNGSGVSTVNLTSLGASSADGVLLVTHGKNEDNYALSRANANGSFTVWVKDNGSDADNYEQDPVSFVYIPVSAVGTKQLVAAGRVKNNTSKAVSGGTFTVTKGGAGQWYLAIPGHSGSTGVLLVSAEGGTAYNRDNIVSSEWDATNSRWVIESRDVSGATNLPTLQDSTTATDDMFSFAFFANTNLAPLASLTGPAGGSFITPADFTLEATASDPDGTITAVEFLRDGVVVGSDNSAPYTHTETGLTNGAYVYTARAIDNGGAAGESAAREIAVTFDPQNIPANTALEFDGVNDHVTMGAAPELNVGGPPPVNGFTLECWFRKDGTGRVASSGSGGVSAVPLFGKGRGEDDGSNIDCNIFFGINAAGRLVADFESQASGLNHPITGTNTAIANGTWHHAAVTFDGTTGTWTLYLDGAAAGTSTVSVSGAVPRYDSIQHFGIGAAFNSSGVPEGAFAGVIDEVRVWSRARSAAEIAAGKDSEIGSATGLIGRFGLNEGVGTSTTSSTGDSTGALVNGPVWVPGAPFTSTNTAPTITLTAPVDGASSYMPLPVAFTATAADADGSIDRVEFYVDGMKIGEDTSEPYSHSWTPPAVGTYAVHARAFDNLGAGTRSVPVDIAITPNPNQAPVLTGATPASGGSVTGSSVSLQVTLNDPESDAMTATFYGRLTTPATPGPDFTLVAIPDTQYYSEGSAGRANTVTVEQLVGTFGAQTQWVLDNKAARNIAFVSHMGDIVNNGNKGGDPIEWERASAAMGRLENPVAAMRAHGIPYGLAPGNHDIDPIGSYDTGSTLFFNQYFGTPRFAGRDYWGGNYGSDNTNNYQLFTTSGLDFLVIHLAYDTTPNQAILDWADALMKAHPHRRVIVTSHYIIGQGNPATFSNQGQALYTRFRSNPNFFLMLCGHIHAEGRRADVFEGRTVYSVLSDYQALPNGGNGFLRAFTFSPANNRIRVESWSPTLNRAASAADNLPHFDGTFDMSYNMQSPVSGWVPLGTVDVAAGGTTAAVNWTGLEAGKTYEWYAAATDGVSIVSTSASSFTTTGGTAPTVTLDAPLTDSTYLSPASVNLTATAADADGTVARVEFYSGGTKIGEDSTAPYESAWNGVQPGIYTLTAIAVDNNGLSTVSNTAAITVNVGDLPPTVSLTAPANGSLFEKYATIVLTADATDAAGPVAKVEFYSGTATPVLLGEDTSAPFSLQLPNVDTGNYTYTARATDSIGQTTTSAPVTVSVFTEAPDAFPNNMSVGTFDPPTWTVAQTTQGWSFNQPGTDVGDLELKILGTSVVFNAGITLANNWGGPASTGNSSLDNIVQPYANASGNVFISVLDNTNNNAAGANPGTSEQTSGVSVAFLPYSDNFTGASINSGGSVIAGNLPAGVTVAKTGTGTYQINGLSTAGNLLAFTNGDTGTLADNVCSVRVVNGRWVIDTRDNAGGTQDNDFSFVYFPPTAKGLHMGRVAADGSLSHLNSTTSAVVSANGVDLTFGDGTVINPNTAALFLAADSTVGGASSTAVDNLICWSPNGNSFRVFTQDLETVNGTHEAIDLRFVAIPYTPVNSLPEVSIANAFGYENGANQSMVLTISRTGPTSAALEVSLVLQNGSTTPGVDYTGFQSSVTIPAGSASTTLTLTVLPDDIEEGVEAFTIHPGSRADYTSSFVTALGFIFDRASQHWSSMNIPDPAKRGPTDDADNDGVPNLIEYFTGTLAANGGSVATFSAEVAGGSAVFRFKRALNRADVTGVVEWSSDLVNWHRSGQSNGTITVNISESTTSAPTDDPQNIDATATNAAGPLPALLFFRLNVTE